MQKFKYGDLVKITNDIDNYMSHFPSGCEAIVLYSYSDKFGGSGYNKKQYCLYLEDCGEVSWYDEHQLTLIESDKVELLNEWKQHNEQKKKQWANIDWIFSNGKEVLENTTGSSIKTLANNLGITKDLWGSHGEGITYYTNAMKILRCAEPFLLQGNKEKWLEYCVKYRILTGII
jgi:hypothetical protein